MAKYALFTDSTTDLPYTYFDENEVVPVAHSYTANGVTVIDDCGRGAYDINEYYRQMRDEKMMPTTSMPNLAELLAQYTAELEAGNDILYLCFSSALSGTYQMVQMAANDVLPSYPGRRIVIIDTFCAGLGQALLVKKLVEQRDNGRGFDELIAYCNELRHKIHHYFAVDDLDYLHRGGRLSKTAALMGGLLGMKPILHCNKEGKLMPITKVRGRKSAMETILTYAEKAAVNPSEQEMMIIHGDCLDDAKYIESELQKRLAPRLITTGILGPVIASHTGPNVIAIIVIGEAREV